MTADQLPTEIAPATNRLLTEAEFHRLADVPPEVEWFANLSNPNTRRGYENAVRDFMRFAGITQPDPPHFLLGLRVRVRCRKISQQLGNRFLHREPLRG
jgi:hypothetical protein